MSDLRYPVLVILPGHGGDYKIGKLYFAPHGWLKVEPQRKREGEEDLVVGEWYLYQDSSLMIEFEGDATEGAVIFRQTGRNMEIVDQIMNERIAIAEHRTKIEELKTQLRDPFTPEVLKLKLAIHEEAKK